MSRDIAAALAARINEVVPDGCEVSADGTQLVVRYRGETVGGSAAPAILDEDGEGLPEERVGTVAAATLSAVQDDIAEALTEPRPMAGSSMAQPDARQTGNTVEMWFGDERDPVVRLRSITLV